MENKKNSALPILRFPEFSGEWEEKRLGEICMISKNKYNPLKDKEIYKCIELEHISQNTGVILGYCNSIEQKSIKNKFGIGDILFGKLRPYLRKYWRAEFAGVCSSEVWVLNGKFITNDFLYQLVKGDKFISIASMSSGSKMPRSDWNYMSEYPFHIPQLAEQTKIAEFLSAIDERLELFVEKKKMLEAYKKGVMQKLFSQALRFKDENGNEYPEWEEQSLGTISDVRDGTHDSPKYVKHGFPFITSKNLMENGKISFDDVSFIVQEDYDKINKRSKVNIGDILFGMIGTIGNPVIVEQEGFAIKNVALIKRNTELNNKYLYQFLKSSFTDKQFRVLNTGNTQKFIALGVIRELKILTPILTEQQKIANFLSALDDKITAQDNKITHTQQYKKALLQQMFV